MAKLAEMSNLSVSHISKLERSRCDIGLKALLRIAAAMEMEADELLPGDFEPKETERKLTAGERFEQIMQGADPQLVEMFCGWRYICEIILYITFPKRKKLLNSFLLFHRNRKNR